MQNPDARHNFVEPNLLFKLGMGELGSPPAHLSGVIQPHGLVLEYDLRKDKVYAVSENLAEFLGVPISKLLDSPLESLLHAEDADRILTNCQQQYTSIANEPKNILSIRFIYKQPYCFRTLVHVSDNYLVLEMTPQAASDTYDTSVFADFLHQPLTHMLTSDVGAEKRVFATCLQQIRELTGYDQVGICHFDGNQNGQVVAELNNGMSPLLGLHFPASAISSQVCNALQPSQWRLVPDVNYQPVRVHTTLGSTLEDSSPARSFLQSVSPDYLQYLRSMGIVASMSICVFVEQRLWGMIFCHHPRPKPVTLDHCVLAQYLGHVLGMYLEGKEKDRQAYRRNCLHLLVQQMSFSQTAGQHHLHALLQKQKDTLCDITQADAFMWTYDNRSVLESGITSRESGIAPFVAWLDERCEDKKYYSTCSLPYTDVISRCFHTYPSGLLAVPLSNQPHSYLIWLRRDQDKALEWAIKPDRFFKVSDEQKALGQTQHASYAEYEKQVSGLATIWTRLDIELALELSQSSSFVNRRISAASYDYPHKKVSRKAKKSHRSIHSQDEVQSLPKKYELLTKKVLPLVWTTDNQGSFCKEQPSWEKYTGQEKHDYMGSGWLSAVHMHDRDHLWARWEQCQSKLQSFKVTVRVWNRATNMFRYCMIYMIPVADEVHRNSEWLGTATDIHELKEKEEKHEKTLMDLKESNDQLKNFAHVASHDLQEPLRVVRSYLSLVEERYQERIDPEVMEFIRFAINGADRMKLLIRELLEYAQLGTEFTPVKVDLEEVLNKVLFGLNLRIEETGAQIDVATLPEVNGVAMLFEQLFTNLLSNALKFRADDESPRIRIQVRERRLSWQIRVEDNGPGIDPNHAERIFDIFFRMGNRNKFPGTGMGLAICKRIVNLHGGKIWVDQEYQSGTCIVFTLRKYLNLE